MEKIIAELPGIDMKLIVKAESSSFGWSWFPVFLSTADDKSQIRLSQYDLMPLARLLYQAYEVIQKEEFKDEAAEAVPLEV